MWHSCTDFLSPPFSRTIWNYTNGVSQKKETGWVIVSFKSSDSFSSFFHSSEVTSSAFVSTFSCFWIKSLNVLISCCLIVFYFVYSCRCRCRSCIFGITRCKTGTTTCLKFFVSLALIFTFAGMSIIWNDCAYENSFFFSSQTTTFIFRKTHLLFSKKVLKLLLLLSIFVINKELYESSNKTYIWQLKY